MQKKLELPSVLGKNFLNKLKQGSLLSFILTIGLGCLPLMGWTGFSAPFELQKVRTFWLLSEILVVVTAIEVGLSVVWGKKVKTQRVDGLLLTLVEIWFAWIWYASWLAGDLAHSFTGNFYRLDGLNTVAHSLVMACMIGFFLPLKSLPKIFHAITLSALILSIGNIWQAGEFYLRGNYAFGHWQGAQGFQYGQPNFLSGFLVVTLPIIWYTLKNSSLLLASKYVKIIQLGGALIAVGGIVGTQSRGGLLGLAVFLLLLLVNKKIAPLQLGKAVAAVLTACCMLFGIWVNVSLKYPPVTTDFVAESRQRIAAKLWLALPSHLWVGWGWSRVSSAFASSTWPYPVLYDVNVDKAHALFLELLVTTGVVGFVIFVFLLVRTWVNLSTISNQSTAFEKSLRQVLLMILVLYIVHAQTNVISITEEMLFWLVVGVSLQKTAST